MPYLIEYTQAAARILRDMDGPIQRRLLARIEALQDNPRPASAIKLSGHHAYRIRVGDYRVTYAIADSRLVVLVVEIGHRREVYRAW